MSILDRMRRITKANINWLLDKVEPAEQELESKIKELEETVQEGRESAASYGATFKRLQRELEQLKRQQNDLKAEAERALKAGDEGTARKALTEKVKLAERISQIQPGVEHGSKTYEILRDNIVKLQEQLKAAKLKLQDLRARKRVAEAQNAFEQHLGKTMGVGGEGIALDRLEDEVLQTEAEVEIRQEIHSDALTDIQLAERSRDLQVEAELEAMKDLLEEDQQ
ncbi:MAG: PspA/IM30 family protein [Phycisphaerae bacterium]|nr:PspA/IM30 family protein [Phycisphaerae bacterium]